MEKEIKFCPYCATPEKYISVDALRKNNTWFRFYHCDVCGKIFMLEDLGDEA